MPPSVYHQPGACRHLAENGTDAGQTQRHPADDECLHAHRTGRSDGGDRGAAGTAGGEVEGGGGVTKSRMSVAMANEII